MSESSDTLLSWDKLSLISNLSFNLMWLAYEIASTKPTKIQVLCYEVCATDSMYQAFSERGVPWQSYNSNSAVPHPPIISDTAVIILASNSENMQQAINAAASQNDAYRARYYLVHKKYVIENGIQHLFSLAWKGKLIQTVFIRLEDRSIYALLPACPQPQVVRMSNVQWHDLRKPDLSNCTLKIAITEKDPQSNHNSLLKLVEPFYGYIKTGLHLKPEFRETPYTNIQHLVISHKADFSFAPIPLTHNTQVDLIGLFSREMKWCVPDSCVRERTTYFLWREFSPTIWIFLTVSFVAVSLSLWLLSEPNTFTLAESLLTVLSTVALVCVKPLPVRVRWIFAGWLWAVLVLSTCYQTVLHSMMAAPSMLHGIEDAEQLSRSRLHLVCPGELHPVLQNHSTNDPILSSLADRTEKIRGDWHSFALNHQRTHAIFTSTYFCNVYYTQMRVLADGPRATVYFGLIGGLPSSWLAPTLRRLAAQAEASGLMGLWLRKKSTKMSCSTSACAGGLQPISVSLLWPSILLLCIGFTLAFVVFLIELGWSCRKG